MNDGTCLRQPPAFVSVTTSALQSESIALPSPRSQQQHNFTGRKTNKLERSPVPSQCQPLVKGRGRCLSNERGWVASASTGSKPASQPAATATGQLLAGGGDVHGGQRLAVPKKPISQVAGPTRHICPQPTGELCWPRWLDGSQVSACLIGQVYTYIYCNQSCVHLTSSTTSMMQFPGLNRTILASLQWLAPPHDCSKNATTCTVFFLFCRGLKRKRWLLENCLLVLSRS